MLHASPRTMLVRSGDGSAKAIYLEAAPIGQHECGIEPMMQALGVGDESIDGIERFTVKRQTGTVFGEPLFKTFETKVRSWANGRRKTVKVLSLAVLVPDWRADHRPELYSDTHELCGEFSRENAVVFARTPEAKAMLLRIEAHAAKGDVAVYWHNGSGNPFHRGGLMISIPSLIEQEFLDDIRAVHIDEKRLAAAAEATGIAARIRASKERQSGRGPLSLTPAWKYQVKGRHGLKDIDPRSTRYDILFYLDPLERNRFNQGWFTVEELDAWLNGSGPVIKTIAA